MIGRTKYRKSFVKGLTMLDHRGNPSRRSNCYSSWSSLSQVGNIRITCPVEEGLPELSDTRTQVGIDPQQLIFVVVSDVFFFFVLDATLIAGQLKGLDANPVTY
jgi:hypothetical protein